MERKLDPISVVKKLYPDSKEHFILEVYNENSAWMCIDSIPLSIESLESLLSKGNTKVNISLIDEYGRHKRPDYSINELLK